MAALPGSASSRADGGGAPCYSGWGSTSPVRCMITKWGRWAARVVADRARGLVTTAASDGSPVFFQYCSLTVVRSTHSRANSTGVWPAPVFINLAFHNGKGSKYLRWRTQEPHKNITQGGAQERFKEQEGESQERVNEREGTQEFHSTCMHVGFELDSCLGIQIGDRRTHPGDHLPAR